MAETSSIDNHDDAYLELEEFFHHQDPNKINAKGPSSLLTRQLILHQHSPKISVISSPAMDELARKEIGGDGGGDGGFEGGFQELLTYFEDHLYGHNSMLSNKLHVKFVKSIDETLRDQMNVDIQKQQPQQQQQIQQIQQIQQSYCELFDMGQIGSANVNGAASANTTRHGRYLQLINDISIQRTLAPFEFFNHPILQLIVISADDTLHTIKTLITDWKYLKYPQWIDVNNDMICVFLIVVDSTKDAEALQKAMNLQEHLRLQMNYRSIIMVYPHEEKEIVKLAPPIGSTTTTLPVRKIGQKFKTSINNIVMDLITKYLAPYMEKKIQIWTEEVLNPRRSFTGRLFGVGRHRWGGTSEQNNNNNATTYNAIENYYSAGSNEYLIRKLGDWAFMLRDFKTSYTTYETLKKDFLKDKAWAYLASLQEYMLMSLLIGSSQKISMIGNGITIKIIDDLINPAIDSLQYSYLSRCYLRSYSLRSILTTAELFISLGESNQLLQIRNNNNVYFDQSYQLFLKLLMLNLVESVDNRQIVMERLSYVFDIFHVNFGGGIAAKEQQQQQQQQLINSGKNHKIPYYRSDLEIIGLTRHRKSELWEYLAHGKPNAETINANNTTAEPTIVV